MKILITGGSGFLGSNLCKRLLEEGNEVTALDNLITGNESNIEELKQNPNFKFINKDVLKIAEVEGDYDRVYHMASPASPNTHSKRSYMALPFETMKANTEGTWAAAQFALDKNAKFLFASTSETYGDPLEHPQKESYRGNVSTVGARSVYDEAKRFGETITSAFIRYKKLDGRIIRIFNTYGPKMDLDDGRAVIEFIVRALKNEPIPIFGDGTQTRSFCYVDDLVDGIIKAMEASNTTGEIFNIGNPAEFTITDLAEVVKRVTGSTSEIVYTESLPEDDPKKRKPDITRARTILKWEPKVNLEEGLKKLITYLKSEKVQ